MTTARVTEARSPNPTHPVVVTGMIMAVCALVLGMVLLVSLSIGSQPLSLAQTWTGLIHRDPTDAVSLIVWKLRMPRAFLAITCGACLAVSGVVMQALTRNPLAEPGILGVNAGASLAVVLAIWVFGATTVITYLWFALAGAGVVAGMVLLMARRGAAATPTRLVLAGIALGASLSAVTGTITMYDTDAFSSYRQWVIGSLEGRDTAVLLRILPFLVLGLVLAFASGHTLNALALGEEQAAALGANLGRARIGALVCITLLCGATTAAIGPMSFIGLIVPHALRLVLGSDQRRLLAASLVAGPVLLLTADVIGRVLLVPDELEAGVVTAFIGGPVLLILALRRGRTVSA